VLSHDTALHIHHLSDVDPAKIHLTVPRGFRATDPLIVAHIGEISESDREEHGSWSVTTPLRTLADVAGSDLSQEHVDSAVSDALDQGVVSRRALLRRASTLSERPALRLERALKNAEEHNGDQ
jgi:predicted transcriptional regulator of viral defense system